MKKYEEIIKREKIIRKKEGERIIDKRKGKIRKNKEIIIKRKKRENIKGVKYMKSPEYLYILKLHNEL